MGELDWGQISEEDCVLRYVMGPHLYGIDDSPPTVRDEVAVIIESADSVITDGGHAPRTHEAAPLRLTEVTLREFVRRLLSGNLTTLLPLLAPERAVVYRSEVGAELFSEPTDFLREEMHPSVLGYLRAKRRELGTTPVTNGAYDRRLAFTVLRVGHQAIEAFERMRVTLPVPEPLRSRLQRVDAGEDSLSSILAEIDELIARFDGVPFPVCTTPLGMSYRQAVVGIYLRHWQKTWRPIWFE
jgi:hypothetical protein